MKEIISQISDAPIEIKNAELKILDLGQSISEIKKQISLLKKETASAVASETMEGKKVYTNAESRETETEKRLSVNEDFQQLESRVTSLEYEKAQEEISLQALKNQFSVNRYKVRLYTADKMDKASERFCDGLKTVAELSKLFNQVSNLNVKECNDQPLNDCPI